MAECNTNDCSSCAQSCSSRKEEPKSNFAPLHEKSSVKKVIGIVSGKGGVGKSLVTSLMAAVMQRRKYKTAILDADVTGPSIPKTFGIHQKATAIENALVPVKTRTGIDVMSINLLLENETAPVIWRGPVIAGVLKQFWSEVLWEDIDFMFIDMPPGTGDVPLTVFQSMPVDGIIIVASPQELVSMIVAKAVEMANMMNIPILGLVENMSYVLCPDCGRQIHVFGESHVDDIAAKYNLEVLGKMPIDPEIASACDHGLVEEITKDWLDKAVDKVESLLKKN